MTMSRVSTDSLIMLKKNQRLSRQTLKFIIRNHRNILRLTIQFNCSYDPFRSCRIAISSKTFPHWLMRCYCSQFMRATARWLHGEAESAPLVAAVDLVSKSLPFPISLFFSLFCVCVQFELLISPSRELIQFLNFFFLLIILTLKFSCTV